MRHRSEPKARSLANRERETNDRAAVLYRKYRPTIYVHCRRILRDRAAAEDASQEVFIRVAKNLDSAPASSEALAWIYRIATNHCLNQVRSDKHRTKMAALLSAVPVVGYGGEDRVVSRELVRRILQLSPTRLAAAAYLHHVDGMSHEEVASILGHSRRTIINHIALFVRRARKLLSRTP
jgi:RNA polymerase sigma-70 factor (ECF subfamily)